MIGWYVSLIKRAAEPRDASAIDRRGFAKSLYGSRLPREGWAATQWVLNAALMTFCAIATAVTGGWWFSLVLLPLAVYAAARTIGTLRERYYY